MGQFIDCDSGQHGVTVSGVIEDQLESMGLPVVSDLPFGHGKINTPLPFGTHAILDGTRGELRLGKAK